MAFRKAMKVDDPLLRSVLLAAVAALLAGCAPEVPPVEPVRPAIVHQVAMSAAGVPAVFAGEVKARHEVDLGFRVSGKIVSRQVDVGARVRRGQVLARLDSSDLALQSDAAAAQLAAAETDLALARSELQRYRGLHAQNFVSQSALEQRQAAFDAATARRRQASSQLEVSRNQAGYAALVADADGVVTAVMAETGQVVTTGQAVVRMALAEAREVAINVPENRIAEVKDAAGLAIALWSEPGSLYEGRLREVSASVDPVTRTFAVRIAFATPPATSVPLGATASVVARGQAGAPAALVPSTAIYHAAGQPAVWIVDPASGKVSLRPVAVRAYREDGVVVSQGLEDGELVVALGVNKLAPGQSVRPVRPDGTAVAAGHGQ